MFPNNQSKVLQNLTHVARYGSAGKAQRYTLMLQNAGAYNLPPHVKEIRALSDNVRVAYSAVAVDLLTNQTMQFRNDSETAVVSSNQPMEIEILLR